MPHRVFVQFLALSLTLHLFLLMELAPAPPVVLTRHLGQPVLDIQLQGDTRLPAPILSSKTAAHSPPATKTSGAHAVAAVETIANPFPSIPAADTGSEPREPISTAKTEAGLRNQLLGELQTRLSHYLTYPPLARSRGWEGTVWLGLRVESDGYLGKIRIERSSGYAVLDHSALNSLNRLGRLAEASTWLNGRGTDVQLPIIYRLIEN